MGIRIATILINADTCLAPPERISAQKITQDYYFFAISMLFLNPMFSGIDPVDCDGGDKTTGKS